MKHPKESCTNHNYEWMNDKSSMMRTADTWVGHISLLHLQRWLYNNIYCHLEKWVCFWITFLSGSADVAADTVTVSWWIFFNNFTRQTQNRTRSFLYLKKRTIVFENLFAFDITMFANLTFWYSILSIVNRFNITYCLT